MTEPWVNSYEKLEHQVLVIIYRIFHKNNFKKNDVLEIRSEINETIDNAH